MYKSYNMEDLFKLFRDVKAKKALIYLIILEYFESHRYGDLQTIYDYVLNHDDNFQFKKDAKVRDGRGISRDYLPALEEANILIRTRSGNKKLWTVNKDYFRDLKRATLSLKTDDYKYLKSYNAIFQKYKDFLPYPASIDIMLSELAKIDGSAEVKDTYSPISLDSKTNFQGIENFTDLLEAIEDREPIRFDYKKYPLGDNRTTTLSNIHSFCPYLLKEHRGRWYLVGKFSGDENTNFISYALDRISNVDYTNEAPFERSKLIENEIWEHSMGIYTSWDDGKGNWSKEPVKISFLLKNGNRYHNVEYLKSNKLHKTQNTTGKYNKDGYVKFTLNMYPDADLVRALRSFGNHNLKDIEPKFLSDWVLEQ